MSSMGGPKGNLELQRPRRAEGRWMDRVLGLGIMALSAFVGIASIEQSFHPPEQVNPYAVAAAFAGFLVGNEIRKRD